MKWQNTDPAHNCTGHMEYAYYVLMSP